ncbi:MAG: DUF4277 domain-containing protein [Pseudonocardiaceae bacterium]
MDTPGPGPFELASQLLGSLPLVNHFLDRTGLPALLERYLPAGDARRRLAPAVAVRLVITNLLVGRQPPYGLGQWAEGFAPGLLGLAGEEAESVNDDRIGRALEAGFDADRASLLTELLLGVVAEFGIDTAELHNDSTSISVHGVYQSATGTARGGKPTPAVTFGHSKDHRPDLKQSVFIWLDVLAYDAATDGCFPLISNDTTLTEAEVLAAYRYQPHPQRRHHLLKSARRSHRPVSGERATRCGPGTSELPWPAGSRTATSTRGLCSVDPMPMSTQSPSMLIFARADARSTKPPRSIPTLFPRWSGRRGCGWRWLARITRAGTAWRP